MKIAAVVLSAFALLGSGPAPEAAVMTVQGSATATLTVHAHVIRNCVISTQPINFGDYDPLVANRTQPLDKQGWVHFACTKGTDVRIELDDGQNASGGQRRMASSGSMLEYELYQDAGHAQRFGAGSNGVDLPAGQLNVRPPDWHREVYGRVAAGQNVAPGDYDDTITATIIF